jgi:hypothetical protein
LASRFREANFDLSPFVLLVPGGGVEPPRSEDRRILSFLRIPYVYDK